MLIIYKSLKKVEISSLKGIFNNTIGAISNKYPTEITPANLTFATWSIIYLWQALWLLFNIFSIFKTTDHGRLYLEPPVLTPVFHVFIFINFGFNIGWLFFWEKSQLGVNKTNIKLLF